MILTCETKAFRAALAVAGKVIPAKSPWPILVNLKLVTNDDRVTLIGSDGDTTFEMDVPAAIQEEGAAAIPFAPLSTFVSAAKGDRVEIKVNGPEAVVKSGRGRIVLQPVELSDFPVYTPHGGEPVSMDPATLASALRFAVAASSDEETRYYLCGVCFRDAPAGLSLLATNGHVLHRAILPGLSVGQGGIVPTAAVTLAIGIAEKAESLRLGVTGTGWHIIAGPTRAFGKVIDGTFPDTDRVINGMGSDGWAKVGTVSRDELTAGLAIAVCGADTSGKSSKGIILSADEGGKLTMRGAAGTAGVTEAGAATTDITSGCEVRAAVNHAYLTATLSGMPADIALDVSATPALRIAPAQESATCEMLSIIMGMRIRTDEVRDAA